LSATKGARKLSLNERLRLAYEERDYVFAGLTALATDRTLYCSQAQPSSMAASPQAPPSSGRIDYLDLLLENIRKSGDLHW
jgi:hypothetical protein